MYFCFIGYTNACHRVLHADNLCTLEGVRIDGKDLRVGTNL